MKDYTMLASLFFGAATGSMFAVNLPTVIVEPFDYAEGSLGEQGDAGGGWGGAWEAVTAGEIDVTVGVMDFPIISATGNYIQVLDGGTIYRDLENTWPDEAGDYWVSFLYQRFDGIDVDDSYNGFSLFMDTQELLYIGKPWGTKNLGLDGTGVENNPGEVDAYNGGWLVVKLVMSGDAENDDAYLWVNPDPSVEPDTANAETHVGWKGSNGFNRVRIGSGNSPNQAECAYDEIRFGQSYGDLTLETSVDKAADKRAKAGGWLRAMRSVGTASPDYGGRPRFRTLPSTWMICASSRASTPTRSRTARRSSK